MAALMASRIVAPANTPAAVRTACTPFGVGRTVMGKAGTGTNRGWVGVGCSVMVYVAGGWESDLKPGLFRLCDGLKLR